MSDGPPHSGLPLSALALAAANRPHSLVLPQTRTNYVKCCGTSDRCAAVTAVVQHILKIAPRAFSLTKNCCIFYYKRGTACSTARSVYPTRLMVSRSTCCTHIQVGTSSEQGRHQYNCCLCRATLL
eukprot:14297-Heterococcus_DN1.PRE.1